MTQTAYDAFDAVKADGLKDDGGSGTAAEEKPDAFSDAKGAALWREPATTRRSARSLPLGPPAVWRCWSPQPAVAVRAKNSTYGIRATRMRS